MSRAKKKKATGRAIGGFARAAAMTKAQRSECSRAAAEKRWKGKTGQSTNDLTRCILCTMGRWRHAPDGQCPGVPADGVQPDYFTEAAALPKTKPRLRVALARMQRAHSALILENQALRLKLNKHSPKCTIWPHCPCIARGTVEECNVFGRAERAK